MKQSVRTAVHAAIDSRAPECICIGPSIAKTDCLKWPVQPYNNCTAPVWASYGWKWSMLLFHTICFLSKRHLCICTWIFSTTRSRSSTFCAIFTTMKQLRAGQSTNVFQLVKSFYNNNPELTYSMVCNF